MPPKPNIGVNVAIFQDGRLLLTKREDFEIWCLPGGAVDPGESSAEAALREVREETGLQVELVRLVGVYSEIKGEYPVLHIVLFAARPLTTRLSLDPAEVLEARFFPEDGLPEPVMSGHKQRILDAFSGAGGGLVWRQKSEWPFDASISREQIYALRDQSGLSRQAFYLQHAAGTAVDETLQVPNLESDHTP